MPIKEINYETQKAFSYFCFSFVLFCNSWENNYIMAKVDETKTQLVRGLKKAVDDTLDDTEDPDEVFRRSIDDIRMNSLNI